MGRRRPSNEQEQHAHSPAVRDEQKPMKLTDAPCEHTQCATRVHACHVSASSAPGSDSTAMSAARAGGVTRQKRSESYSTY